MNFAAKLPKKVIATIVRRKKKQLLICLKKKFFNNKIKNYRSEIQENLHLMLQLRNKSGTLNNRLQLESNYNNLNSELLTDEQILSLILYEMEKKHHFTGDGIWGNGEIQKAVKSVS